MGRYATKLRIAIESSQTRPAKSRASVVRLEARIDGLGKALDHCQKLATPSARTQAGGSRASMKSIGRIYSRIPFAQELI